MTVGSLFSGIGGFDLGLERAGFSIKWQVENNEYCRKVLRKHWPAVPCHYDITTIDWATVQRVDLLCGGFPCQDLSFAGKRAGIDGARSGLWSEYARAIGHLRPRYILVENVPGLLTNQYMGRVLGDLAACGYDAEWDCIPASMVGAPHRRERIWLLAYPERAGWDIAQRQRNTDEVGKRVLETQGERQQETVITQYGSQGMVSRYDSEESRTDEEGSGYAMADSYCQRKLQSQRMFSNKRGWIGDCGWWAIEPPMGRVAYGIPGALDRLKGLGNAIVPQIAEAIGRMILEAL